MSVYVYGILDAAAQPPAVCGIDGGALWTIPFGELAALVSDLDGDPHALRHDARVAHDRVLAEALAVGTVLPIRFGVVLEDETAVQLNVLAAHHHALQRQLTELRDMVELRVRVVAEDGAVERSWDLSGERRRDLEAMSILDGLAPLALASEVRTPIHERVVIDAAFLVPKRRVCAFGTAVDALRRAQGPGVIVTYRGPMPPHSFVELRTAEAELRM
jgi:Gas vesicle synthesis protein GvpL/GvpF